MFINILINTVNSYIKIFPYILLAYILIYILRKFKIKKYIKKLKDKRIIAFLLGILSHGPIYAWYPIIKELNFSDKEKFVFLYLRAIKLPHIPLQIALLGLDLTILLNLYIILVGLIILYGTTNSFRTQTNKIY